MNAFDDIPVARQSIAYLDLIGQADLRELLSAGYWSPLTTGIYTIAGGAIITENGIARNPEDLIYTDGDTIMVWVPA